MMELILVEWFHAIHAIHAIEIEPEGDGLDFDNEIVTSCLLTDFKVLVNSRTQDDLYNY